MGTLLLAFLLFCCIMIIPLGLPGTWLILGVLFFPAVWAISWIFIRRSIWLEEDEVRQVKSERESR